MSPIVCVCQLTSLSWDELRREVFHEGQQDATRGCITRFVASTRYHYYLSFTIIERSRRHRKRVRRKKKKSTQHA